MRTDPPTPTFTLNGKIVLLGILTLTLITGIASYLIVPKIITRYLTQRPQQLQQTFQALEKALVNYATDHQGQYPPLVTMESYRRKNKNLFKSHANETKTFKLSVLTTPVNYIHRQLIVDPFAMPEQYVPPAVLILNEKPAPEIWLYSPGPDLIYQLNLERTNQGLSPKQQRESLSELTYDPSNGINSSGDIVHLVKISLDL